MLNYGQLRMIRFARQHDVVDVRFNRSRNELRVAIPATCRNGVEITALFWVKTMSELRMILGY